MTGGSMLGLLSPDTDSISTQVGISTGVWSFVFKSSYTGTGDAEFWFVDSSTSMSGFSQNGYAFRYQAALGCTLGGGSSCWDLIATNISPQAIVDLSSGTNQFFDNNLHTFRVTRSTQGYMEIYADGAKIGAATDLSVLKNTWTNFKFTGKGSQSSVINFKLPGFYQNQESIAYNTTFSTPVWGPYSVAMTSAATSSVTFNAQFSTSANGPWSLFVSQPNGAIMKIAASTMPYVRDQIIASAPSAVPVSTITSVSINAASTGTFVTQCINIPSTISKWGTLNCSVQTSGGGSLAFFSSSAATCAGLPTSTMAAAGQWTATTNNATLGISTNAASAIRFDSVLRSSRDMAQVSSCTLNFFSGTPPPPVWGIYNPINNAIYWSGDVNASTTTNRWFKYDLNNQEFCPFDVPPPAPLFYKSTLFFGSGGGGYWYQFSPTGGNCDDGSAINSFWVSKDWNLGEAFQEKNISAVSLVGLNHGSGTLTVTESGYRDSTQTHTA